MKHQMQKKPLRKLPPPKKAGSTEEDNSTQLFRHALIGFLISLLATPLLLLICTLIAYFSPDPNLLILPLGITSAALCALIGGFSAARLHGHTALLCGLTNAILLTVFMLVLSLFFRSQASHYSTGISILLHSLIPLLSVTGAYFGLPKAKKRSHRSLR